MNSGKAVILALLAVALAAASYAWWHQRNRGRQVLQLWGSEAAWLIRHGDRVQLWRLKSAGSANSADADDAVDDAAIGVNAAGHFLAIDGVRYVAESSRDISAAPGIEHARQALIEDVSFNWPADTTTVGGQWQVALKFAAPGGAEVTLLLDLSNELIRRADDGAASIRLAIGDGLRQFIEEQGTEQGTEQGDTQPPVRGVN